MNKYNNKKEIRKEDEITDKKQTNKGLYFVLFYW